MPDNSAQPLCSTCGVRDISRQVAFMMGAIKVAGAVAVVLLGIVFSMIIDTRADNARAIEVAKKDCQDFQEQAARRDQEIAEKFLAVTTEIANDNNEIVRVLGIISVNQKRILNSLELDYMSPEEVHRSNDRPWK